jgi:hypothetical protein
MKKALTYIGGLIGLYVVVSHATGFGTAVKDGASGGSTLIKTLQGR